MEPDLETCRAVLEQQRSDWNAGDVEAFMTGYAASEETTFVSGSAVKRGYAAVLSAYRLKYASKASMGELSFSDVQLRRLSTTVVLATGRFAVVASGESATGLFSLVLVRGDGGWKVVHDHTHST